MAAARDAAFEQIDYLLITHFHGDHDGGVPELAQLIPIRTFIDHGSVPAEAESVVAGTIAAFPPTRQYARKGGTSSRNPAIGCPLKGIEASW